VSRLPPEIKDRLRRRHRLRQRAKQGAVVLIVVAIALSVSLVILHNDRKESTFSSGETENKAELDERGAVLDECAQNATKIGDSPTLAASQTVNPAKTMGDEVKDKEAKEKADKAMGQWAEASKSITAFLMAPSVQERIKWAVPTPDLESRLGEFEARSEIGQSWFGEPESIGPQFALREGYLITTVTFAGRKPRHIAVEATSRGWLVDWESYVGYCEKSLRDLAGAAADSPPVEVRAEAYLVSPPPPQYPANEYLALMLRHPDEATAIQVVAPLKMLSGSEAGKALAGNLPGRYTLKVRSTHGGWAQVSEVVCPGWVPRLYLAQSD
jgi:hypothetical protein